MLSTIQGMSVCQGLSVWIQMYPAAYVSEHIHLSPFASSQTHLRPSYLQSFLSSVRSRQARIIQSSFQPSPHHRYESIPEMSIQDKQESRPGAQRSRDGDSWKGLHLSGGAINDGVSIHMCSSHRWKVSPWEVNAHYSSSDHMVVFPAGLLLPPFFHPGYPRYGPFSRSGRKFPKSDGQMLGWVALIVGQLGLNMLEDSGVRHALVPPGP